MTPGGTTKVLADLQTGVVNARNALENTKAQLRLSQRTVAQLTRQTEDLKESRERLRLENEGLNNVVARKERLLQEVSTTSFRRLASLTSCVKRSWRGHERPKLKSCNSRVS
jgi:DNA anti-recombination protein RmuC